MEVEFPDQPERRRPNRHPALEVDIEVALAVQEHISAERRYTEEINTRIDTEPPLRILHRNRQTRVELKDLEDLNLACKLEVERISRHTKLLHVTGIDLECA